jgi:hypothetical protein
MSRRVRSSSSERTGAGKTRFFACDARVVENCLDVFLAGDARSILEAREMVFIVNCQALVGSGENSMISEEDGYIAMYLGHGPGAHASMRFVSMSNDVGLNIGKAQPKSNPRSRSAHTSCVYCGLRIKRVSYTK